MTRETLLCAAAAEMGAALTEDMARRMTAFHDLLTAANRRMNLTRVPEDFGDSLDRNYLDSLAPLASGWPEGVRTLIDVGSGAGFPGVPLSIALPGVRVTLLEAQQKRADFLRSVVDALGLNAEVICARAEDAGRRDGLREGFDIACARAVAPLNVLAEYLLPFARVGGKMLALKGPTLQEELDAAAPALKELGGGEIRVTTAALPRRGDWTHRLVWVDKAAPTPERYPRRAGVPEKRPLNEKNISKGESE